MQQLTNRSAFRIAMAGLVIYAAVSFVLLQSRSVAAPLDDANVDISWLAILGSALRSCVSVVLLLFAWWLLPSLLFRRELRVSEDTKGAALFEALVAAWVVWCAASFLQGLAHAFPTFFFVKFYLLPMISIVPLAMLAVCEHRQAVRQARRADSEYSDSFTGETSLAAADSIHADTILYTGMMALLLFHITSLLAELLTTCLPSVFTLNSPFPVAVIPSMSLGVCLLVTFTCMWRGRNLAIKLVKTSAAVGFLERPAPSHVRRVIVYSTVGAASIFLVPSLCDTLHFIYGYGWRGINSHIVSSHLTMVGLLLILILSSWPVGRGLAWYFVRAPHHYFVRNREQQLMRHGLKLAAFFIFSSGMHWIRISEFFQITYERNWRYQDGSPDGSFATSHLHDILVSHTWSLSYCFVGMLLTLGASMIAILVMRSRPDGRIPPPDRRVDIYLQYAFLVVAIFMLFANLPEAIAITVNNWDRFWPWYGELGASGTSSGLSIPWFIDPEGPAIDQAAPLFGNCILAVFLVLGWGFRRDVGAVAQGGR